jgi:glycosyltransferase involved in cell wall biosynthesis
MMKRINKEVSIVIPTKNNGDILEKCFAANKQTKQRILKVATELIAEVQ